MEGDVPEGKLLDACQMVNEDGRGQTRSTSLLYAQCSHTNNQEKHTKALSDIREAILRSETYYVEPPDVCFFFWHTKWEGGDIEIQSKVQRWGEGFWVACLMGELLSNGQNTSSVCTCFGYKVVGTNYFGQIWSIFPKFYWSEIRIKETINPYKAIIIYYLMSVEFLLIRCRSGNTFVSYTLFSL